MSAQVSLAGQGGGTPPSGVFNLFTSIKPVTYGEVFNQVEGALSARLEAEGKSLKRVDNFRTARNGWMKACSVTEESTVGAEFGSEFSKNLDRHLTVLGAEGKATQTLADRRSILTIYREAWVSILQSESEGLLEGDFAEALDTLIESSGRGVTALGRESGVSSKKLYRWRKGESVPSRPSLLGVHKLENIFGLPCGALAAKLPSVLLGDIGVVKTGLTGYTNHLCEIHKSTYLLNKFPTALQGEWGDLFLFYTDAAWVRKMGLKRNSRWRVREHDNSCPSSERILTILKSFFGYSSLPVNEREPLRGGKDFKPEELTLALLSDNDLVYSFLQFKKERTYLKRYNSDTHLFLVFCLALLRPETGYLWQSPQFGARLPKPVAETEWRAWCGHNRSILKSTLTDLIKEGEIKMTRDPFEPIRSIIVNNQHPLDVLLDLAAAYEADAPPRNASPRGKAAHYQNLFLIKFATFIPLRLFNLSVMTWRADNTGNLYQKPDGSWWVRFDSSYMKNHKGAARDAPFDVPLHESLWAYAKEFLLVHRPHLPGSGACDYVFRTTMFLKGKSETAHLTVSKGRLTIHIRKITQRYIPDCPGFGLHAFRHLVATEYIKNNPAGYAIAAAILNDREETVKRNYAWVLPADKFCFWNVYICKLLKNREGESPSSAIEVAQS